jgi:hypothetical protein
MYSYRKRHAARLSQTGCAHPCHICTGTWLNHCHICTGTGPTWFGVFIAMLRTAAAAAWRTAASGWSSTRTSAPIAPAAAHLTYQSPQCRRLLIPPKVRSHMT